jgi:hypothetical protein
MPFLPFTYFIWRFLLEMLLQLQWRWRDDTVKIQQFGFFYNNTRARAYLEIFGNGI